MTERPAGPTPLRLGARGSKLSRTQSAWVADRLRSRGHSVEFVVIETAGDAEQAGPIDAIDATGVFTTEVQRALLAGRVDLAVHSLKDLPTAPTTGLVLAAIPPREAAADALVSRAAATLDGLPRNARVGTGSHRRRAQLLCRRPDLRVLGVRGNVDTRLRKLHAGEFDAIVVAQAGLHRLGLAEHIAAAIPESEMLPAPGQGALAIECRSDDLPMRRVLAPLDDPATHAAVTAERSALARLEGGCLAAMGAWARVEGASLQLSAAVLSVDGRRRLATRAGGDPADAEAIGQAAANDLLARGAGELLTRR